MKIFFSNQPKKKTQESLNPKLPKRKELFQLLKMFLQNLSHGQKTKTETKGGYQQEAKKEASSISSY